jgi:hypothetical protein
MVGLMVVVMVGLMVVVMVGLMVVVMAMDGVNGPDPMIYQDPVVTDNRPIDMAN